MCCQQKCSYEMGIVCDVCGYFSVVLYPYLSLYSILVHLRMDSSEKIMFTRPDPPVRDSLPCLAFESRLDPEHCGARYGARGL